MVNQKGIKERASEALKSVNKVRRYLMPKKGEDPSEVYLELQKAKNQLVSLIKLLLIILIVVVGFREASGEEKETKGKEGDSFYTAKPDPLHEGEYITEDRYGHRTGFIKKDPLHTDRFIVEDNYGHRSGEIRPDTLNPDSFNFNIKECEKK